MNNTELNTNPIALDEASIKILNTLLYFNIFNHPLLLNEIIAFSTLTKNEIDHLNIYINALLKQHLIYQINGYYTITNQPAFVERRISGNRTAQRYLKRAKLVSRIISWFPFVRGVMISGSLSKEYMDAGSDIDYFIVTEKGRLWICRSLLALLRKVMIGPMRKYFCINYFVGIDALLIPDKNLFTATEIITVYPTYRQNVYEKMQAENDWIKTYFPNKKPRAIEVNSKTYFISIKTFIEWILKGDLGEKLDTFLFDIMLKRWKKKYADFDETQFDINIRTKKNISKQHEKGHQFVILQKYKEQINNFEREHHVTLHG